MNPTSTLAVTSRVLTQLRRDRRTMAMLLVLPCALMTLLWWMFQDLPGDGFSSLGPALLALIPFVIMFLVTSVTTLRERTSGTLERLLTRPRIRGRRVATKSAMAAVEPAKSDTSSTSAGHSGCASTWAPG